MDADTLKSMRLDKRLTQQEVADRMGVSQAHYSKIERGEKSQEVVEATQVVSRMRYRGNRTGGGVYRTGRKKG